MALGRLARSDNPWVEVIRFLGWLKSRTTWIDPRFWHESSSDEYGFYHGQMQTNDDELEVFELWLVDAVLGTLFHFGVIEKGVATSNGKRVAVFRLTGLGQAIFGGPDISFSATQTDRPFLTVQPNFELIAEQTDIDTRHLSRLARMTEWTGRASGPVRTCKLTGASVSVRSNPARPNGRSSSFFHARETSVADQCRAFDFAIGRRSWNASSSSKMQISFWVRVADSHSAEARRLSPAAVLVTDRDVGSLATSAGLLVANHRNHRPKLWMCQGGDLVTLANATSVDRLKLASFCHFQKTGRWTVDWQSLKSAQSLGVDADRIESWLDDHLMGSMSQGLALQLGNLRKRRRFEAGIFAILRVGDTELAYTLANLPQIKDAIVEISDMRNLLIRKEDLAGVVERLHLLGFDIATPTPPVGGNLEEVTARKSTKKSVARKPLK